MIFLTFFGYSSLIYIQKRSSGSFENLILRLRSAEIDVSSARSCNVKQNLKVHNAEEKRFLKSSLILFLGNIC